MFKKIYKIVLIAVLLYFFYHLLMYGFTIKSCVYRIEDKPVPKYLADKTLTLENNEVVIYGKDPTKSCVPILKDKENEIILREYAVDYPKEFEKYGRVIKELPAGKKFTIDRMLAETKHGITTIDSGGVPIYYLILTDEQGESYMIATVFLTNERRKNQRIDLSYFDNNVKKSLFYDKDGIK